MKHIAKRLREDSEYQGFFLNALHKFNKEFGTKGIGDMSDEEKQDFFNYVDKNYKGKAESLREISTLGASGIRRIAQKHGFSVSSKPSGGRVPYITLTKDGKKYGPFDPTITTVDYLAKQLDLPAEVIKEVDGPLTGTVNVVFSIQKDLPSTDTEFLKKHIAKILQNMFSRERGIKFEVERKYGEPQVNLQ